MRSVHKLRIWALLLIAVIFAAVAWVLTLLALRAGWPTPSLPYSALITLAVVIVVVFSLGWRVRLWQRGTRKQRLNPLLAARTLLLAQASAYAGALIAGWHVGIGVDALSAMSYGAPLSVLGPPAALVLGGLVMVAVGMIVERFCQLPPEDPNDSASRPHPDDGQEYAQPH